MIVLIQLGLLLLVEMCVLMGHEEELSYSSRSVEQVNLQVHHYHVSIPLLSESMATTASSKPGLDGLLIFEQPFARVGLVPVFLYLPLNPCQVPYENYRKVFRSAQKNIERELGAIQTISNDLAKNAHNSSQDPQEAIKSLEGMIGRVEGLKRKVGISFLFQDAHLTYGFSYPICKRLRVHLRWTSCASGVNTLLSSRIFRAPKTLNTCDGSTPA